MSSKQFLREALNCTNQLFYLSTVKCQSTIRSANMITFLIIHGENSFLSAPTPYHETSNLLDCQSVLLFFFFFLRYYKVYALDICSHPFPEIKALKVKHSMPYKYQI